MLVGYNCPIHGFVDEACCEGARRVESSEKYVKVPDVRRDPVNYDYECINPEFLKWMAMIGPYAAEKYGSWHQYTGARLVGEKSPMNHIQEHKRAFQMGEPYDHFDKDPRWHLAAIGYNAMMEFFFTSKFGLIKHPLLISPNSASRCICGGAVTEGPKGFCSNCKLPLKAPPPSDLKWLGWMCNECDWRDRSSYFERTDGEPCPQCVRENRNGKILSFYKKV